MNIPNVSVAVDITSIAGVRLSVKGGTGAFNFDVKGKLEEKERRSQMVIVNFSLFLTTKPSVVKFEVEGTATLTGKDEEISKMLEVDPEIKVPYVFQEVYQNAFAAMYLLSTILKAPPPPHNLFPRSQTQGIATEDVDVESIVGEVVVDQVEERTEEPPSMESGGATTEVPETPTRDVNVEPRAEERVERRTEGLADTEG
ncbi:hypothetical protein IBX35_00490 [Candidatus Bathyarchaeota archaeon]|nr:hypothetical protein [Candidatus Bathyarchaeota archaeon]